VAITALLTDDAIPAKLAEGAAAVGATDVHTDTEQAVKLGLHQLPARAADGTCKLGTAPGRIGYAIVELEGERVLILHVAPRSAGDDALRAGRKLVASLKKL
jgi:hypothetical protein